jgi:hypothetical protein
MKPSPKKERIKGLEELCRHLFVLIAELQEDIKKHEEELKLLRSKLK